MCYRAALWKLLYGTALGRQPCLVLYHQCQPRSGMVLLLTDVQTWGEQGPQMQLLLSLLLLAS